MLLTGRERVVAITDSHLENLMCNAPNFDLCAAGRDACRVNKIVLVAINLIALVELKQGKLNRFELVNCYCHSLARLKTTVTRVTTEALLTKKPMKSPVLSIVDVQPDGVAELPIWLERVGLLPPPIMETVGG